MIKIVTEIHEVVGPIKRYAYVNQEDPRFLAFSKGVRVLPAPYFEENYNMNFTLRNRFEPGENRLFPNGGFEVWGPDGGVYNYDLDQVIVHPYALKMKNYFSTDVAKVKEVVYDGPKRKRGRPQLVEGQYVQQKFPTYVPNGGRRGRKSLDPAVKAARELEKIERNKISGGKRGRPKKELTELLNNK